MRFAALISAVCAATLLAGCAASGPPRVVQVEPPRLMLVGVDTFPADIRTAPLHVVFEESESMTQYLREAFKSKGFEVTATPSQARYRMVLNGHFKSRGKITVPDTPLGPIFDDADAAMKARDYRTASTGKALTEGAVLIQAAERFNTGYMNLMGAGIIGAIFSATGIEGRLNAMTGFHPQGICMSNCEDWEFNRQHARVEAHLFEGVTQLARFGRAAETYQPEFIPQELIRMALDGTVNAVFEGAQK